MVPKIESFWYSDKRWLAFKKSAISAALWQPAPNRLKYKHPAQHLFCQWIKNGSNLVQSLLRTLKISWDFRFLKRPITVFNKTYKNESSYPTTDTLPARPSKAKPSTILGREPSKDFLHLPNKRLSKVLKQVVWPPAWMKLLKFRQQVSLKT